MTTTAAPRAGTTPVWPVCPDCGVASGDRVCRTCGRQLEGFGATHTAANARVWLPSGCLPPRVSLAVTAASVIVLVLTVGAPTWRNWINPPEAPILAVVDAVDNGRFDDAAGFYSDQQYLSRLLLPTDADAYTPPQNVDVVEVSWHSTTVAEVSFTYRLAGSDYADTIAVERDHVFDDWRIRFAPGMLHVQTQPPIPVDVAGADTNGAVVALPGVYTATAAHPLFQSPGVNAAMGFSDRTVALDTRLRPDADTAASGYIDQFVSDCAASGDVSMGSGCPFYSTRAFPDTAEVAWRIHQYPRVHVTATDTGVTVATVRDGVALARLAYGDDDHARQRCTFSVDGSLALPEMVWSGDTVANHHGCESA